MCEKSIKYIFTCDLVIIIDEIIQVTKTVPATITSPKTVPTNFNEKKDKL